MIGLAMLAPFIAVIATFCWMVAALAFAGCVHSLARLVAYALRSGA